MATCAVGGKVLTAENPMRVPRDPDVSGYLPSRIPGFNFVYDQHTKSVSGVACRMGLAVTYSGMLCRFWRSSAKVWRALTSTAVSGMIPDTHAKTVKTALPQVPHAHGPHHSSPMREADLRVPAVRAQGNAQVPTQQKRPAGLAPAQYASAKAAECAGAFYRRSNKRLCSPSDSSLFAKNESESRKSALINS